MGRRAIQATRGALVIFALLSAIAATYLAVAASREQLSKDAQQTLQRLYQENATASALGREARAVLVFPRVIRTGLVARPYTEFGGAYGEGAVIRNNAASGIYIFVSSSGALKNDAASFSCVIFLMTPKAEAALGTGSWKLGVGPSVAVVGDAAPPSALAKDDAQAFVFGPQGPIALGSLNGVTISPIGN